MSGESAHVNLVVMGRGGIFGAWLEPAIAHTSAQAIGGMAVDLPISVDYRPKSVTSGSAE